MRIFKNMLASEAGASAIEYALVASLIAVAGIAGMANLGNSVDEKYNTIDKNI